MPLSFISELEIMALMNNIKQHKISRIFFFLICFCGCFYHVWYVNNQYFSYKTTTRVESKLQDVVNFPTIILCARIADMIDPAKIVSLNSSELQRLTIKEILELTPKKTEIINECQFRGKIKNRYLFEKYNRTECYTFRSQEIFNRRINLLPNFHNRNYELFHIRSC